MRRQLFLLLLEFLAITLPLTWLWHAWGRDAYLETVEPMARKSVQELRIREVVASGKQAAVWFENRTSKGVIPSCDWLRVEGGLIKEIQSFYDSAMVREVLSPEEQDNLGGSY